MTNTKPIDHYVKLTASRLNNVMNNDASIKYILYLLYKGTVDLYIYYL